MKQQSNRTSSNISKIQLKKNTYKHAYNKITNKLKNSIKYIQVSRRIINTDLIYKNKISFPCIH